MCIFFLRSGLLVFLFLIPLGFLAYRWGMQCCWTAYIMAALGNLVISLGLAALLGIPPGDALWDLLYFGGMAFIFCWICAPPPLLPLGDSLALRFMVGSVLGGLLFLGIFLRSLDSPGFQEQLGFIIESLSGGGPLFELLTIEAVIESVRSILLRGGAIITSVIILALGRQGGYVLSKVVQRERTDPVFISFRVRPQLIWAFSLSLLFVVLTRSLGISFLEIVLWNILVLCTILYLAQGIGILQFFLARPSVRPGMKFFTSVIIVLVLLSPVINGLFLGGLVLLGAVEHWVPFRVPKEQGPPSTPEGGD